MSIHLKHKQTGFTLIELIVVILILGILAAIATPVYFKVIEQARYAEIATILGSVKTGVKTWQLENGTYPPDSRPGAQPGGNNGVENWPNELPFGAKLDYDNWNIGGGRCYVQVAFWGESGQPAYRVGSEVVRPPGIERIGDNLVLGIDTYDCGG
ncbi:MAG: prepilin-type N-terminal cleavage/methylation domain-containing protein [Cyanothece sp. SIO1E1]|nr:prepilin-type N-terminal cleavage/methylation domain-containing protein [Cyanothece sp. SIO1E1]